ncbi:MAG: hypothetical protein ACOY3P_10705 [Planctomycetota bacterium]
MKELHHVPENPRHRQKKRRLQDECKGDGRQSERTFSERLDERFSSALIELGKLWFGACDATVAMLPACVKKSRSDGAVGDSPSQAETPPSRSISKQARLLQTPPPSLRRNQHSSGGIRQGL